MEKSKDSCPTCQRPIKALITPPVLLTSLLEEYVELNSDVKLPDEEIERRNRRVNELKPKFERRHKNSSSSSSSSSRGEESQPSNAIQSNFTSEETELLLDLFPALRRLPINRQERARQFNQRLREFREALEQLALPSERDHHRNRPDSFRTRRNFNRDVSERRHPEQQRRRFDRPFSFHSNSTGQGNYNPGLPQEFPFRNQLNEYAFRPVHRPYEPRRSRFDIAYNQSYDNYNRNGNNNRPFGNF
ncbi:hypothetical protein WR25_08789 [Diploscapter pachys]|uniref:BESS domain-containing protein n=1 Tax=Diploscapter pachys TaxID=2018661 RepID=A0A2A2KRD1_9BILA|nr:hypothetical protein WR25_08789 [Diploscapter pachys]